MIATLIPLAVLPSVRTGARPKIGQSLPHLQLDQLPDAELVYELAARSLEIPLVHSKQSRMASPDSLALYLMDEDAGGPPEAFIDGHEFCHLHPVPEGGAHLTLPKVLREEVVRLGWGESHPIANLGILTTLVTVYAPRDRRELKVVLDLVWKSCQFAQGNLKALHGGDSSLLERG